MAIQCFLKEWKQIIVNDVDVCEESGFYIKYLTTCAPEYLHRGPTVVDINIKDIMFCNSGVIVNSEENGFTIHTFVNILDQSDCKVIFNNGTEATCDDIQQCGKSLCYRFTTKSGPNPDTVISLENWRRYHLIQRMNARDVDIVKYDDDQEQLMFEEKSTLNVNVDLSAQLQSQHTGVPYRHKNNVYVLTTYALTGLKNQITLIFLIDGVVKHVAKPSTNICVVKCMKDDLCIYYVPSLSVKSLKEGPSIVDIKAGKTFYQHAGVVMNTDESGTCTIHTSVNLSDQSDCKVIFSDGMEVICDDIERCQKSTCFHLKTKPDRKLEAVISLETWRHADRINKHNTELYKPPRSQKRKPMTTDDIDSSSFSEKKRRSISNGISRPIRESNRISKRRDGPTGTVN